MNYGEFVNDTKYLKDNKLVKNIKSVIIIIGVIDMYTKTLFLNSITVRNISFG